MASRSSLPRISNRASFPSGRGRAGGSRRSASGSRRSPYRSGARSRRRCAGDADPVGACEIIEPRGHRQYAPGPGIRRDADVGEDRIIALEDVVHQPAISSRSGMGYRSGPPMCRRGAARRPRPAARVLRGSTNSRATLARPHHEGERHRPPGGHCVLRHELYPHRLLARRQLRESGRAAQKRDERQQCEKQRCIAIAYSMRRRVLLPSRLREGIEGGHVLEAPQLLRQPLPLPFRKREGEPYRLA